MSLSTPARALGLALGVACAASCPMATLIQHNLPVALIMQAIDVPLSINISQTRASGQGFSN